ncbi:phenylalanine--tRNA ligase subunit beta [Hymenobacter perfusus]|uniref:Phenylalanine--tRNA ligase beta subunit n=1 Tax=Hymenobacter perfusus TaxID=1236770 RepID=A0A428K409_9BACT|nr:phenylalanine--tRNA ligase subunit beta [Hymenobacter perfusus]RSK40984.1 phenylalanine--tRNA ligase subunit beta [Hymenobacter perfusus]
MKISLDWLRTLIPTDKPAEEIGKLLTGSGLEVEGIEELESVPGGLRGVVLGTVLTREKHPDADKLSVTTVDVGDGTIRQIVCGAPNVAAGQRVVVALDGAMLYPSEGEPFKIKKSKIRGLASEGMICAEDEIGLGQSHAGIMVLTTDQPNGTPAAEYFGLGSDAVLEIGLTPNRADAASHYGVARELRALLRQPCHLPDISGFHAPVTAAAPIAVTLEDAAAAPRYAGLLLENVQVGPSPEWLQRRLRSIGLSPINNVVDVTNFVLHELGQPLHAFDADQITGNQIRVKRATEGEKFTTLDGTERTLRAEDLVIADAHGTPMALAGVFGGKTSGVSEATTRVFLESAYFAPAVVRKTGQTHQLKTDASFRFERGTDPNMVLIGLKRAALLLQEVAGATVAAPIVDEYPAHIGHTAVRLRLPRVEKLVGQFIAPERIRQILTDLDILISEELTDEQLTTDNQQPTTTWILSVPPHKVDVTREADVIEEILRIYGYNHVALRPHNSASYLAQFPNPDPEIIRQNTARLLSGQGFSEIITNSITNSLYFEKEGEPDETLVRLLNFNSAELNVMRPSLLPSGLEVIRHNVNRRQRDLKLYEFGKTYRQKAGGQYEEHNKLVIYLTGNTAPETWQQKSDKSTYHQLAGAVQQVLASLGFPQPTSQPVQHPYLAGGLTLLAQNQPVAQLGAVSAQVLKRLDVSQPVWYAELDWDWLMRKYKNALVARELPKFPEVRRDLSLVVDKTITFDQLQQIARRTEKKLLQQVNVFDVYEGDNLGQGKKSYSVSFFLQDPAQTLTDQAIDSVMNRLIQQFEQQAGAVIRR